MSEGAGRAVGLASLACAHMYMPLSPGGVTRREVERYMPGGRPISPIYGFVQAWTVRTLVCDVTGRRCRIVSLYPFPILDGRLVRVGWNLSMESSVSGPREGENNSSIHTPDGHELAGSISAAVSSSGSELRSIPPVGA